MKFYTCVLILVTLLGCQQEAEKIDSQAMLSISGRISTTQNNAVDSDTNDLNAFYSNNNSIENAQAIPNSITLSGYVNIAGTGNQGRSYLQGDSDDFYSSYFLPKQNIAIFIDTNTTTAQAIDFSLLDNQGNLVKTWTGVTDSASITVDTEGKYFIQVHAGSGASSYLLTINSGQTNVNSVTAVDLHATLDFVPGEIIVNFKKTAIGTRSVPTRTQVAQLLGLKAKAGGVNRNMLFSIGDTNERNIAFKTLGINVIHSNNINTHEQLKIDTINIVNALNKRPDVVSARLNYIRQTSAVPDDRFYPLQWHYPLINLPQAWDITTGSPEVTVAVVDTGILSNHPDLQGKLIDGYDFIRDITNAADGNGIDNNPEDEGDGAGVPSSFHGTHVAGTIAATTNNNLGVAGIA